ncbi:hypothetical protein DPMN_094397 [Dreissena polymorpha]|uniref:Uncharacterized protein n=1 Tax=Dreissena polymorpha TaxID=45954 RepID=A0A9D4R3H9_DREPO|nr:hypothetical protein DPMN_094397 [Dreissena polymorpha]
MFETWKSAQVAAEMRKFNLTILRRTNQQPVEDDILQRRWRWIGHILCKPAFNMTRQSSHGTPKRRGREGGLETRSKGSKFVCVWKGLVHIHMHTKYEGYI